MPALEEKPITRVMFSGDSEAGRVRSINQDSFFVGELGNFYIAAVADGMGGHKTGEVASQKAIEILRRELLKSQNHLPIALARAVQAANLEIHESSNENPEHEGMGTTLTSILLDDQVGLIGHVGDSRAYLVRDGKLKQLTLDHSWVAERVRQGVLTQEEAQKHRLRNIITNALGSEQNVKLDILHFDVQAGDKYMVCSDGVSMLLDEDLLRDIIHENSPDEAVKQLIDASNERGSADNITAVVVQVNDVETRKKPYALPTENLDEPHTVDITKTLSGLRKVEETYPRQDRVSKMKRQAWYPYRMWILGSLYLTLLIIIFTLLRS